MASKKKLYVQTKGAYHTFTTDEKTGVTETGCGVRLDSRDMSKAKTTTPPTSQVCGDCK